MHLKAIHILSTGVVIALLFIFFDGGKVQRLAPALHNDKSVAASLEAGKRMIANRIREAESGREAVTVASLKVQHDIDVLQHQFDESTEMSEVFAEEVFFLKDNVDTTQARLQEVIKKLREKVRKLKADRVLFENNEEQFRNQITQNIDTLNQAEEELVVLQLARESMMETFDEAVKDLHSRLQNVK